MRRLRKRLVGIDAKAGDLKVGDEILVGHGYWTIRDVETGLMNPDTGGLTGTVYLLFTRTLGDETESGWDEVAEDCSVVVRR